MNTIEKLLKEVSIARNNYIGTIHSCTTEQAEWKSSSECWNIIEITEHLYWAEQGGIWGMWKTIDAIHENKIPRTTESIHQNMTIEELIGKTWASKEQVPSIAAPRMGGSLTFWISSLQNLQNVLNSFAQNLTENELRIQAQPHPISGAMDFQQRFEFIRFHLDRHRNQAIEIFNSFELSIKK